MSNAVTEILQNAVFADEKALINDTEVADEALTTMSVNAGSFRRHHSFRSLDIFPINENLLNRYHAVARLTKAMKNNSTVYIAYDDADSVIMDFADANQSEQPELTAMILHQAMTLLFTLFGNLMMIFVILRFNTIKRRKKVSPVQLLMLHMCTSDILYAGITIFPTMMMTITVPIFHGPNWLCKMVKFLQVVPMYSSSFLLVAISADRYFAICRPLASMRSSQYSRSTLFAAIAWLSAIMLSTPQSIIFSKNEFDDCTVTYTQPWQYPAYVCFFNIAVWLLPSITAGILYFHVCRAVRKSLAYDISGRLDASLRSPSPKASAANEQKRVATVKLTLTIVAANFVLWAPFCIISVIDALHPELISPIIATYVMFFGNLNSCMNPWIWFFFNRKTLLATVESIFFCKLRRDKDLGTSVKVQYHFVSHCGNDPGFTTGRDHSFTHASESFS